MSYLTIAVIAACLSYYNATKVPNHFINRTEVNKYLVAGIMGLIWPATLLHKGYTYTQKLLK